MIIGTLFFLTIMAATIGVLCATIGEHLDDILTALEHDAGRIAVKPDPRPRLRPAALQLAAAA